MNEHQEIFDMLSAPFPTESISWRVGSTTKDKKKGKALAYIDARDVMDRLDFTVGFDCWECNYVQLGHTTICNLGLKIGGVLVWKADGAGGTDYEAEKGALSDAFKRAAVKWGVGRYLYSLDGPWVALTDRQQIADRLPLDRIHDRAIKGLAIIGGKRKSIALARHDKDFEKFSEEINKCSDLKALEKWWDMRAPDRSIMPKGWEKNITDEWETRRNQLIDDAKDPVLEA